MCNLTKNVKNETWSNSVNRPKPPGKSTSYSDSEQIKRSNRASFSINNKSFPNIALKSMHYNEPQDDCGRRFSFG